MKQNIRIFVCSLVPFEEEKTQKANKNNAKKVSSIGPRLGQVSGYLKKSTM